MNHIDGDSQLLVSSPIGLLACDITWWHNGHIWITLWDRESTDAVRDYFKAMYEEEISDVSQGNHGPACGG